MTVMSGDIETNRPAAAPTRPGHRHGADDKPGLHDLLYMSYTGEDERVVHFRFMQQVRPHWRALAIALKFPRHEIAIMEKKDDQMYYLMSEWLRGANQEKDTRPVTWRTLIAALRHAGVQEEANVLEKHFIQVPVIPDEKQHFVPDALLQELVCLRISFGSFLHRFEKVLTTSPGTPEVFLKMLNKILHRAFTSFQECFDTLIEEEVSLFNITYLKQICTPSDFPENVCTATQELVREYEQQRQHFMTSTTLTQFATLFPASATSSARMVPVRLKLQNFWGERTLDDLTNLVVLLGVPGTHLHLTRVNEGCIAVTWLCSTSYVRELKQAINQAAGSLRAEGVLQVFTGEEMVLDCRHQHDQPEEVLPSLSPPKPEVFHLPTVVQRLNYPLHHHATIHQVAHSLRAEGVLQVFTAKEMVLRHQHDQPEVPEMYTQALKRGSVEVSYGRVMLLGLAAAGKTSLMHGLMNVPLPDKANSTILASTQSRALPDMSSATDTASAVVQEHMKEVLETMKSSPIPQSSDKDTNKEVLLHIWDCGGHPVFLSVLPAFLSSRTVFLLVFDASINLDEPCRVIVNNCGEQQMMETLDISGLHLLQQWMASIHARFSRVGKSANLPRYPRILLVGTHSDCLTAGQSEKAVLEKIYSSIKANDYSNMVIGGMVVDNTTAGMGEEEDKEIKKLRDSIHQFVQDKLCVATPVSWVQFRQVLQLHVKQDHPVLSLDEVRRYAKESFVPKKEVSSALSFYHELGVLLFYPKVPGLESVVILEPQWLVDCFGALLCKWKSRANHRYMWNILGDYGILIENLYNEVLEPILRGSQVSPQSIVEMLQHFLLAAPITTAGLHAASGKQKEYFVPLMLEHRLPTSTTQESSTDSPLSSAVKRAATVYVTFESGYVAPGFYVRLATCLSDREGVVVLFKAGIYRNQITMRIGDVDMLIITEHIDSVEVSFFRTLNATKSFRKSCREVRLMFRDCFSLISKWLPGVAPHVAFSCPQCESAQVSHSQARSCIFSVQHRASDALHCKGVHSFYPNYSQRYWLLPIDNVNRIEQAMEKREQQSSEFMQSLTSAIGDKMGDVAKELEMSLSDDLLEQFYKNGGDDIELAQCLRAVKMKELAKRLVTGKLVIAESTTSSAPTAAPVPAAEAETQSGEQKFESEPISVVLLVDAVKKVNDWHNLGLHLYLEEAKLEEIGIIYYSHGVGRVKAELFKVWLKSCPDASWHKLVSALNEIGEKRVAKEVESNYCIPGSLAGTVSSAASASYAATSHPCLDRSSLRRVFGFLTQYSDWESLGLLLGLESATLGAIEAKNSGKKQACKRKMLEYWLDGKDQVTECGGPTWQQLADCLKQLGEDTLAQDIEEQYCHD